MTHDKRSFANEYCLCRQIPHRWVGGTVDQLVIGNRQVGVGTIYSIHNLSYDEIVQTIDKMCEYSEFGRFIKVKD